jgi:hypothetical protein
MTRAATLGAGLAIWLAGATAAAHDFTPGVLSLVEVEPGTFRYVWTEPVDSKTALRVSPRFPPQCRRQADRLECGAAGLSGIIRFDGLNDPRVRVIAIVRRLDAPPVEHLVDGGDPALSLERPPGSSLLAWLRIGAEHVLLGLDHVAFLIGLLLVTGLDRRIVTTVTAFTLAHSLTLALATFGVLRLASAPVEATIAASVLLVAREAMHDEPSLTRRRPWVVALVFGLVHGLGFAGALSEIGIPEGSAGWALFGFNAGVELGQLALVGLFALGAWAARDRLTRLRPSAGYVLGGLGAWWLIDRALGVLTGSS